MGRRRGVMRMMAQAQALALLLPAASAPLGSFCATEERGCFRDCYDPAKKQCAPSPPPPLAPSKPHTDTLTPPQPHAHHPLDP